MIKETPVQVKRVHIKNFKSIVDLPLDLASINVFIGENGSGKSNILEALAFAAAAAADKLDNEFLASRGIRVTDPRVMRSAFAEASDGAISIHVEGERGLRLTFEIDTPEDTAYPKWRSRPQAIVPPDVLLSTLSLGEFIKIIHDDEIFDKYKSQILKSPILEDLFVKLENLTSDGKNSLIANEIANDIKDIELSRFAAVLSERLLS